ncbi:MAG: Copper homeostasis protein CutC [Gemmatimonadaceae bacterium]|nr:Copper homeostasis protein CutC [Gemmatimonadaceae bacterium]
MPIPGTPESVLFESCVDSVSSALSSAAGGANRIELCDNLIEGGTTPSTGTIAQCIERVSIPVCVMIRPRGGDYLYDADEVAVMERDIRVARQLGAAGVVLGALAPDGSVDLALTERLVEAARPLPVTFHRAFDRSRNLQQSLEVLIRLGVDRVLTSGGMSSAIEGAETLGQLVVAAGSALTVMAGGGVRPNNVGEVVRRSGVREVHARLVRRVDSPMRYRGGPGLSRRVSPTEEWREVTSRDEVSAMMRALDTLPWKTPARSAASPPSSTLHGCSG